MSDEGLGIAAVGFQHFEAAMADHVGLLDQVGAALHCGVHEARPQAKAAASELEFGGPPDPPIWPVEGVE
jgi:hypothetical protein